LKALADLRKTVIDETQKVTQRAQDLTSGLWRDVAVSAAPFVLKALGDAGKTASPAITAGFYFAAAIFIVCSFALQVRINKAFLDNQDQARTRWFMTLYGYISATERKEIAEEPINNAVESYRETRGIVASIYIVLVILLVGFGIASLNASGPTGVTSTAVVQRTITQDKAAGGGSAPRPTPSVNPAAKPNEEKTPKVPKTETPVAQRSSDR
jgi:hypothetical protein